MSTVFSEISKVLSPTYGNGATAKLVGYIDDSYKLHYDLVLIVNSNSPYYSRWSQTKYSGNTYSITIKAGSTAIVSTGTITGVQYGDRDTTAGYKWDLIHNKAWESIESNYSTVQLTSSQTSLTASFSVAINEQTDQDHRLGSGSNSGVWAWTPPTGKINITLNEGVSSVKIGDLTYNESATGQTINAGEYSVSATAKSGYTISSCPSTITITSGDIKTINVSATKNRYTVTYKVDREGATGATADRSSDTVEYGSTSTFPTVSGLPSGYELKGWSTKDNNTVTFSPTGNTGTIEGNCTYYAVYTITSTFVADGSTVTTVGSSTIKSVYGTTFTFPSVTVTSGYKASSVKYNGSYAPGSTSPAVTSPITYTASATERETVTITFNLDDNIKELYWRVNGGTYTKETASTTVEVYVGDTVDYYTVPKDDYHKATSGSFEVTGSKELSVTADGVDVTFNYTLDDGTVTKDVVPFGSTYSLVSSSDKKKVATSGTLTVNFYDSESIVGTGTETFTANNEYAFSGWTVNGNSEWSWNIAPSGSASTGFYYDVFASYGSSIVSYSNYTVTSDINVPYIVPSSEGICSGFYTERIGGTKVAYNGETNFKAPISVSGSGTPPTSVDYYAHFNEKAEPGMYLLVGGVWRLIHKWDSEGL